jgi:hypothetical protein
MQPRDGGNNAIRFTQMAKKPKAHKPASKEALRLRKQVAENVSLLMARDFPPSRFSTSSARERKLAKEAGVSWSTIQRVLAPLKATQRSRRRTVEDIDAKDGTGTRIDTIADLASVFGVRPAELLTPNFAYELINPAPRPPPEEGELQRRSSG